MIKSHPSTNFLPSKNYKLHISQKPIPSVLSSKFGPENSLKFRKCAIFPKVLVELIIALFPFKKPWIFDNPLVQNYYFKTAFSSFHDFSLRISSFKIMQTYLIRLLSTLLWTSGFLTKRMVPSKFFG